MTQVSTSHARPNSRAAITSMVMGILSVTLIPLLLTIPAIILGIVGMKKIKNSNGNLGGQGFALTGVITGAVGLFLGVIVSMIMVSLLIPALAGSRNAGVDMRNTNNARVIMLGCRAYADDNQGKFPATLDALVPDYIDDSGALNFVTSDGEEKAFHYVPGFSDSSPGNSILLYTDPNFRGHRIIGRVSSAVEKLFTEEEFQKQLNP